MPKIIVGVDESDQPQAFEFRGGTPGALRASDHLHPRHPDPHPGGEGLQGDAVALALDQHDRHLQDSSPAMHVGGRP